MSLPSTKRGEDSPVGTRVNTSLGSSLFSPNKTVKLAESHYSKSDRFKGLEFGSTWKMFVLPEFRSKETDLGESMSTIPTPQNKTGFRIGLPPHHKQKKENSKQSAKPVYLSRTNNSLNDILESHVNEPENEPVGTTYLREQAQYLRAQFSECLRKKYRPHCKTLYD